MVIPPTLVERRRKGLVGAKAYERKERDTFGEREAIVAFIKTSEKDPKDSLQNMTRLKRCMAPASLERVALSFLPIDIDDA
jgi:hypothetical protein